MKKIITIAMIMISLISSISFADSFLNFVNPFDFKIMAKGNDPTDTLLPNTTNTAYYVDSTTTNSPAQATNAFTDANYNQINVSDGTYKTDTATQTITAGCNGDSPVQQCGSADCSDCTFTGNCNQPSTHCPTISGAGAGTDACTYYGGGCHCVSHGTICLITPLSCTVTGSCSYKCNANNYWNGTACNSTPTWIYTFQRFTFNLSSYNPITSGDNITFSWKGLYNNTASGGANSSELYWYNQTSGTWTKFQTLTFNSLNTYTLYFQNSTNLSTVYNATSGLVQFAIRGNQSQNGYTLTLYSDYAYLNVSYPSAPTSTCTYGGSGDWQIDCKDDCNITNTNITGVLRVYSTGSGYLNTTNINATSMVENYTNNCYVIRKNLGIGD